MPTHGATLGSDIEDLLRVLGSRWGLSGFEHSVRVEWSRRLRRSLGRAYLARRVVRVSVKLANRPSALLLEVVCHEVAHLAVCDIHGRRCQAHGPEWADLVRAAGFEPRRRIPWSVRTATRAARQRQYVHHCPVCHFETRAGRPVLRWRCAACVAAGLSGRLEISSAPSPAHT